MAGFKSCQGVFFVLCLVIQSCPTLCNPMDYSLPGSSVHEDSPGKNTGLGSYAILQGNFPTQGLNPGLLHCRRILYCLGHQGSPMSFLMVPKLCNVSHFQYGPQTPLYVPPLPPHGQLMSMPSWPWKPHFDDEFLNDSMEKASPFLPCHWSDFLWGRNNCWFC